jgi:hypothetical protein
MPRSWTSEVRWAPVAGLGVGEGARPEAVQLATRTDISLPSDPFSPPRAHPAALAGAPLPPIKNSGKPPQPPIAAPSLPSDPTPGAAPNDFEETKLRCFIDGAYMDVCVYENLCLSAHDEFLLLSKTANSAVEVDRHMWHTLGVKCVRNPVSPVPTPPPSHPLPPPPPSPLPRALDLLGQCRAGPESTPSPSART